MDRAQAFGFDKRVEGRGEHCETNEGGNWDRLPMAAGLTAGDQKSHSEHFSAASPQ
jgi:hypothetical protein